MQQKIYMRGRKMEMMDFYRRRARNFPIRHRKVTIHFIADILQFGSICGTFNVSNL